MPRDIARRNGQCIEVDVKALDIPRYVNRTHHLSNGEQQLERFLTALVEQKLVDPGNAGAGLSKDGSRFGFLITPLYPKSEQLEAICTTYKNVIGRQLIFVIDPDYRAGADIAAEFDWGGILARVVSALGRLSPFD